jgi:hypothetical protein
VPLSRVIGARAALLVVLVTMAATCALEFAPWRPRAGGIAAHLRGLAALLALVAAYTFVVVTLWLPWGLGHGEQVTLLTHLGSIHSGRYAKYAIFIAEHDRVPFLAQNAVQSILASLHMMLGTWNPLVALMAWLPVSMAFLSLLFFGLFRSAGFAAVPCAAAAFMVMFCNVAISTVHVLVFDNGSPFSFVGYTDTLLAVGGFVVFAEWLRDELVDERSSRGALAVPALLAATWCWHAPHNIVIAAPAAARCRDRVASVAQKAGRIPRLLAAGVAFVVGVGIGRWQLGSLLPAPLREETGLWTQEVGTGVGFRPYVQYLRNHWTRPTWNIEPGVNHLDTAHLRTRLRAIVSDRPRRRSTAISPGSRRRTRGNRCGSTASRCWGFSSLDSRCGAGPSPGCARGSPFRPPRSASAS